MITLLNNYYNIDLPILSFVNYDYDEGVIIANTIYYLYVCILSFITLSLFYKYGKL
jgi:hypothetical protein